ncbi:hypothetical protein D3C76_977580 [compost metagenome]
MPTAAQAVELTLQALWVEPDVVTGEQCRQGLFQAVGAGQCLQLGDARLAAALAGRRKGVEYTAPPKGTLCTLVTQYQPITVNRLQRCITEQLGEHARARQQLLALQQSHPGGDILGAQVHVHRAEMLEGAKFAGQ